MAKRPFIRKQKRKKHGTAFWDSEYVSGGEHLALSTKESKDLAKFTRWLLRQKNESGLNTNSQVVDFGCGNGRNLIFLAQQFNLSGIGYDSSAAAIAEARKNSNDLKLEYETRSIAGKVNLLDASQDLALDMMSSHFLSNTERELLKNEIFRILKPGGWLYMKTFLLDDDLHSQRLLKDHPGNEPGTYIHPVIGVPEHVYTEKELVNFLEDKFIIHKVYRSHKHKLHGQARKRRTISVYAQKDPYK